MSLAEAYGAKIDKTTGTKCSRRVEILSGRMIPGKGKNMYDLTVRNGHTLRNILLVFLFLIILRAGGLPAVESQPAGSPTIFVPEPRYEFAPVVDGREVAHDFVIQNKGDAPLIIERVKTD